jgi:hypothetical protein
VLKQNISDTETYAYSGHDALIVSPSTQLIDGYDTTCPYTDMAQIKTNNNMPATVYCGIDLVGSDYCPNGNGTCHNHVTSLEQCLEICSQSHPLCWGASFDPTLITGWGNCYLKGQSIAEEQFTVTGPDNTEVYHGAILHSAVVEGKNGTDIAVNCSDRAEVNTIGETFVTVCNSDQSGNDLWSYHEDTLEACVSKCANWSSTGGECVAVTYDAQVLNGWENCYLKYATGVTVTATNRTLAVAKSVEQANSGGSGGSSGSKAWIAGVVVGVVAPLCGLVGIFLWLRRRKRMNRADSNDVAKDGYEKAELPTSFGSPRQQKISEMYGVDKGTPRWELDGSSKPSEMPG